ncbi:MAG: type II secretion system F family protein [Anaerovoracaceae bacterium]
MRNVKNILEEGYGRLYGGKDCTRKIEKAEKQLKQRYFLVLIIFGIIIILSLVAGHGPKLTKNGIIGEIQRPGVGEEPIHITAKVKVMGEDKNNEKEVEITVEPLDDGKRKNQLEEEEKPKTEKEQIDEGIKEVIREINKDTKSKKVVLPSKLSSGEILQWKQVRKNNTILILLVMAMILFLLHRSRLDELVREEKAARESIIKELPEFINNLILLLNAGTVLNGAFIKVMEEHEEISGQKSNYFYDQLGVMYKRVKETNGSINEAFREFAKRSSVKELMRVSNVINDNIKKGSDMVGKLQQESLMLWFARKQQAEEKGRLAETKLTMPLVILLLVLIMVTIAPALMEL